MVIKHPSKKSLGIFTLAMINVAAICAIRNLPTIAESGFTSLFYLLLASLIFFIPSALVCAELASAWAKAGGVFAWIKEAFGHKTGFLAIWLLWFQNVIWYPTALSFVAGAIAYFFEPSLVDNRLFNISVILIILWVTTLVNLLGMRTSSFISTLAVLVGTIAPGFIIILLGFNWFFGGHPLQISFTAQNFFPNLAEPTQLVIFTGFLLALLGMEMSSVHVKDVKQPHKDYPKAILISAILIFAFYALGGLAIAVVIPQEQISLTSGSLQAFSTIVESYGLSKLTPYMAFLILLGAIGSISTWVAGPVRGLLAAAQTGDLPPFFRKINRHEMPVNLLLIQAVVVSILSMLFVLMPSINSAYWILSVMVTQVYLVMYLMLFSAAIKLRYKRPDVKRLYKIPGGLFGMWLVAGVGFIGSLATIIIGFFPPAQIATGNVTFYVSFLLGGMILICLGPSIILLFKKPSWEKLLKHEK
ncbi:MAG TPA: amino acid permease [Rhabdochlamydiaceae bacterium]|nr:amino acid permease [Rhabdochlamydiaceae bacterium]